MASFKQPIQSCIDSANNINDLIPLLHHIPLDAIKAFAYHQFESLNTNSLRTAYYNSLSMNEILPQDIAQHMLSFAGLYHTMTVSKAWKRCSEKNVTNYLRKSYESTNPKQLSPPNVTIIVDNKRSELHKIEKEFGFVIKDLFSALNDCKDGDRILIHNGHYTLDNCPEISNSQLVGIGNDVDVVLKVDDLAISGKTYIENVTLRFVSASVPSDDPHYKIFYVGTDKRLWIKHCVISDGKLNVLHAI